MSQSYLGKLNPTVGRGLGGIPEKAAAGGGIAEIPILNSYYNGSFATSTGWSSVNIGFTPLDARTVGFEVTTREQSNSTQTGVIYFSEYGSSRSYVIQGISGATIKIYYDGINQLFFRRVAGGAISVTVRAIEYGYNVLNSSVINAQSTSPTALPFTIQNIRNVFIRGSYDSDFVNTPHVTSRVQTSFSASQIAAAATDSELFIIDSKNYSIVGTGSADYKYDIIEFEAM